MITKLLNEVNEKIETLNNLVQNKEYFEKLDERIEKVNNYIQEQKQENERLHSIIKEVRKYILQHCEIIRFENENVDKVGKVEGIPLLEILDKEKE